MQFRGKPHELDGSDHIECAIKSANWAKEECTRDSKVFIFAGIFWIIIAFVTIIIESDFWWASLMLALAYMFFGLIEYDKYINKENSNEYLELIEFKELGTINGIEVKQI